MPYPLPSPPLTHAVCQDAATRIVNEYWLLLLLTTGNTIQSTTRHEVVI